MPLTIRSHSIMIRPVVFSSTGKEFHTLVKTTETKSANMMIAEQKLGSNAIVDWIPSVWQRLGAESGMDVASICAKAIRKYSGATWTAVVHNVLTTGVAEMDGVAGSTTSRRASCIWFCSSLLSAASSDPGNTRHKWTSPRSSRTKPTTSFLRRSCLTHLIKSTPKAAESVGCPMFLRKMGHISISRVLRTKTSLYYRMVPTLNRSKKYILSKSKIIGTPKQENM